GLTYTIRSPVLPAILAQSIRNGGAWERERSHETAEDGERIQRSGRRSDALRDRSPPCRVPDRDPWRERFVGGACPRRPRGRSPRPEGRARCDRARGRDRRHRAARRPAAPTVNTQMDGTATIT